MNINELRKIVKQTIIESKAKSLSESLDYNDVIHMLSSRRENINSIGIMTAENPQGITATKDFNLQKNKEFAADLRSKGFGFRHIGGKFNVEEDSFLIQNISREQLIEFGQKYEQDAIIFGYKTEQNIFHFEYIEVNPPQIIDEKEVVLHHETTSGRPMYSTAGKGPKMKKFVIPFFDSKYNILPKP